MSSSQHINQAAISVLLSLSVSEPSESVSIQGDMGILPTVLNKAFKPELLSVLGDRADHFLKIELDINALNKEVDRSIAILKSIKDSRRIDAIRKMLMDSDAPFPMMHSIYKMKQGDYRSWRKELSKEIVSGSIKGGKLKNLTQAEEELLASKIMELSNIKKADEELWLAGELFWELHVQTEISVRQIWAYVIATGVV